MRRPLFPLLFGALLVSGGSFVGLEACSDDPTPTPESGGNDASTTRPDGSTPEPDEDSGSPSKDGGVPSDGSKPSDDGSCPGEIKTGNGETCIGYGTGSTCDPQCGQPYGYVCVNGAPPGFTGCRQVSQSALGDSFCCPKNDCVAQPDQNAVCDAGAGKTKRYQCPPGSNAPPAGCVEYKSGGTNLEKLYCCP